MADEATIATKLQQIEQYYGELRTKQRSLSKDAFLERTTEQRAIERMFENVIQASADLAQHIATREFDHRGDSSKDAIRILADEDVIAVETMETLVDAVGFRNVLAHQYGDIEYSTVYEILQTELDVYDEYSRQIAEWFRSRQ